MSIPTPETLRLRDEASELLAKCGAVVRCLYYGRKELSEDEGETIDGVTWFLSDSLRRLQEILDKLGRSA